MNMKNIILTLGISFLISSCGTTTNPEWFCSCSEQDEVANFVTDNTGAANNMSDEEMEDVIKQLRREGVKVFCHQKMVTKDRGFDGVNWTKTAPLDSCEVYIGRW
jgi:hypothetical protein